MINGNEYLAYLSPAELGGRNHVILQIWWIHS